MYNFEEKSIYLHKKSICMLVYSQCLHTLLYTQRPICTYAHLIHAEGLSQKLYHTITKKKYFKTEKIEKLNCTHTTMIWCGSYEKRRYHFLNRIRVYTYTYIEYIFVEFLRYLGTTSHKWNAKETSDSLFEELENKRGITLHFRQYDCTSVWHACRMCRLGNAKKWCTNDLTRFLPYLNFSKYNNDLPYMAWKLLVYNVYINNLTICRVKIFRCSNIATCCIPIATLLHSCTNVEATLDAIHLVIQVLFCLCYSLNIKKDGMMFVSLNEKHSCNNVAVFLR